MTITDQSADRESVHGDLGIDARFALLVAAEPGALDAREVRLQMRELSKVRAWVDARETALAGRLRELGTSDAATAQDLGAHGRQDSRTASKVLEREALLRELPDFASALSEGAITAGHTDALANTLKNLNPQERDAITNVGDALLFAATQMTADRFGAHVKKIAALHSAASANERFERQRRRTHLRHWVANDGMVHLHGEFDPERGAALIGRLQIQIEAMFHSGQQIPESGREPGIDPNAQLAALALINLTERAGGVSQVEAATRAEISVVVDLGTLERGLHAKSVVRTDSGVDLSVDTIRRLSCSAEIIPMVMDGHGVVIDVGRTRRLATAHQRRVINAMYSTCAIPGCSVKVSYCVPHHIEYWEHGGRTDMANLVPLCSMHHHAAHEGGWKLELSPERVLRVTRPDGRTCTGPPG